MIEVAVVASSPLIRSGLEAMVRRDVDLHVAAVAADVLDLNLEGIDVLVWQKANGAEVEAYSSALADHTLPLVLIAQDMYPSWSSGAVEAGVRAILPVQFSAEELNAAIRAAFAGWAVLRPEELISLLRGPVAQPAQAHEELSPREVEVLRMVAEGLSNKEIAWRLQLSEHTIKYHVNSILTKLNASSRTEAVILGLRQGVILL